MNAKIDDRDQRCDTPALCSSFLQHDTLSPCNPRGIVATPSPPPPVLDTHLLLFKFRAWNTRERCPSEKGSREEKLCRVLSKLSAVYFPLQFSAGSIAPFVTFVRSACGFSRLHFFYENLAHIVDVKIVPSISFRAIYRAFFRHSIFWGT